GLFQMAIHGGRRVLPESAGARPQLRGGTSLVRRLPPEHGPQGCGARGTASRDRARSAFGADRAWNGGLLPLRGAARTGAGAGGAIDPAESVALERAYAARSRLQSTRAIRPGGRRSRARTPGI